MTCVNFGDWYPYKYDRRHDFSFVYNHKINDKIDFSITWVYSSGNAVSFPQATYWGMNVPFYAVSNFTNPNTSNAYTYAGHVAAGYVDQGLLTHIETLDYYGNRNSTRMSPYHRLDFGINFHKKRKHFNRTISFSIYNIYNRKNPFFIYLDIDQSEARQVSLFPIIPTLTYSFSF